MIFKLKKDPNLHILQKYYICPGVEIGRQAPLRWVCRKVWRFESSPGHRKQSLALPEDENRLAVYVCSSKCRQSAFLFLLSDDERKTKKCPLLGTKLKIAFGRFLILPQDADAGSICMRTRKPLIVL